MEQKRIKTNIFWRLSIYCTSAPLFCLIPSLLVFFLCGRLRTLPLSACKFFINSWSMVGGGGGGGGGKKNLFPRNSSAIAIWRTGITILIKKKIKFSSYIRKFIIEQLQSHIWLTAFSYCIWGYICTFPHILGSPSSYMTLQLLHSEFLYIWGKIFFLFFYQCNLNVSASSRTMAGIAVTRWEGSCPDLP